MEQNETEINPHICTINLQQRSKENTIQERTIPLINGNEKIGQLHARSKTRLPSYTTHKKLIHNILNT